MTPNVPEEDFITLLVEPISPETRQPTAELRLSGHAEQQFFAMRFWGRVAGIQYAEAFNACTPRTRIPPRALW